MIRQINDHCISAVFFWFFLTVVVLFVPLPLLAAGTATVEVVVDVGVCGDDIIGLSEDCEGADLNDGTCKTEGFASGTLTCTSSCDYDTSGCVPPSHSSGLDNSSSDSGLDSSGDNAETSNTISLKKKNDPKKDKAQTVTAPIEDFTQFPFNLPNTPRRAVELDSESQDLTSTALLEEEKINQGDAVDGGDGNISRQPQFLEQVLPVLRRAGGVVKVTGREIIARNVISIELVETVRLIFDPVNSLLLGGMRYLQRSAVTLVTWLRLWLF